MTVLWLVNHTVDLQSEDALEYATFKSLTSSLIKMPQVFYFRQQTTQSGQPYYTQQYVAVGGCSADVVVVWNVSGFNDPTPANFATDFPNAIQLSAASTVGVG